MKPIVRTTRPQWRRHSRLAAALAGAGALATLVSLAGISVATAATPGPALAASPAHTPPTFTHVAGSPNPVVSRRLFRVTARECDRVADVYATGTMTFVDVTTGVKLGTVTLSPSPKYVNCGQAKVTDREKLRAGKYEIRARYTPGGRVPVPRSAPAHYQESVRKHKRK